MRSDNIKVDPKKIKLLPPLVLLFNLTALVLMAIYSLLNLRPYVPTLQLSSIRTYHHFISSLTFLLPTAATVVYLRPVFVWLGQAPSERPGFGLTSTTAERAANAPLALAGFSFFSWLFIDILLLSRLLTISEPITFGMLAHFIIRPLLSGLIAATAVYFGAEYICRMHLWPVLFGHSQMESKSSLWMARVAHRFFFLWIAISLLPLSVVVLTALIRMDRLDQAADPLLFRAMYTIIFISASAALCGAGLAWLVARSLGRPLRALENAMARLSGGDFSVRQQISGTDEIGALAQGFNLMTKRLSESYQALDRRNRELTQALERVTFLESVKRGLDRFVPDTVRRAIETNPDGPALLKMPKDVTVLFVDIQGYTRLSEELPPGKLNEVVERYFSLFLPDIRAGGGDINETAGDGLMILFQEGKPEEHATSAIRTALAIREKTVAANYQDGFAHPPIAVNIGISTGECEVGSTRFQSLAGERWTFTATGPVTNLAARLCDQRPDTA